MRSLSIILWVTTTMCIEFKSQMLFKMKGTWMFLIDILYGYMPNNNRAPCRYINPERNLTRVHKLDTFDFCNLTTFRIYSQIVAKDNKNLLIFLS